MIVAAFAILIASPFFCFLSCFVAIALGSPVLFRQRRPGLHNRLFTMMKYRTMTDARDASGRLLPDDQRRSRIGDMLRRWSLDELPELVNVVRGHMSLVGPRPLLREYLDHYSADQCRRHLVRPGITGLAQVNGRNATTWDERFEYDLHYVDNVSFSLDCAILWATIATVLRGTGDLDQSWSLGRYMGPGKRPDRSWDTRSYD